MFNLHHLRYFYVCAQTGSITRAAESLGMSQPGLSMQIKQFEKQIGIQILARTGRTLTLTPKGRELFAFSARFFETLQDIEGYLKKSESVETFDLRIGVGDEVERPFMADVLGKLVKAHREKRLSATIVSRTHDELLDLLASGDVDVIVVGRKARHGKLIAQFKTPVVLVTSTRDPNARMAPGLNLPSLLGTLGFTLLQPMDSISLGRETREFLKSQNLKVRPTLQSNILACLVRAVEEGLGAAFLPVAYVKDQFANGTLTYHGPKNGFWQHSLYLYGEKQKPNAFVNDLALIMQEFSAL